MWFFKTLHQLYGSTQDTESLGVRVLFRALKTDGYYFHLEQRERPRGKYKAMLSNHTEQQIPKERDSCYPSTSETTEKAVRRATLEQGECNRRCSGRPEGMNLRIVMNMSSGITMVTSTLFPYTAGKCYCPKYALRCNKTESGSI